MFLILCVKRGFWTYCAVYEGGQPVSIGSTDNTVVRDAGGGLEQTVKQSRFSDWPRYPRGMDKHEAPAPIRQLELFSKSEELYWQFPRRRGRMRASMRYHRSGAAWWFRQMRVAADRVDATATPHDFEGAKEGA